MKSVDNSSSKTSSQADITNDPGQHIILYVIVEKTGLPFESVSIGIQVSDKVCRLTFKLSLK